MEHQPTLIVDCRLCRGSFPVERSSLADWQCPHCQSVHRNLLRAWPQLSRVLAAVALASTGFGSWFVIREFASPGMGYVLAPLVVQVLLLLAALFEARQATCPAADSKILALRWFGLLCTGGSAGTVILFFSNWYVVLGCWLALCGAAMCYMLRLDLAATKCGVRSAEMQRREVPSRTPAEADVEIFAAELVEAPAPQPAATRSGRVARMAALLSWLVPVVCLPTFYITGHPSNVAVDYRPIVPAVILLAVCGLVALQVLVLAVGKSNRVALVHSLLGLVSVAAMLVIVLVLESSRPRLASVPPPAPTPPSTWNPALEHAERLSRRVSPNPPPKPSPPPARRTLPPPAQPGVAPPPAIPQSKTSSKVQAGLAVRTALEMREVQVLGKSVNADLVISDDPLGELPATRLNLPERDLAAPPLWSADGRELYLLYRKGALRRISTSTWTELQQVIIPARCSALAQCSEGLLVSAHDTHQVWLVDAQTWNVRRVFKTLIPGPLAAHPTQPWFLTVVDGALTLSAVDSRTGAIASRWDYREFGAQRLAHFTQVSDLAFSEDGKTVCCWDRVNSQLHWVTFEEGRLTYERSENFDSLLARTIIDDRVERVELSKWRTLPVHPSRVFTAGNSGLAAVKDNNLFVFGAEGTRIGRYQWEGRYRVRQLSIPPIGQGRLLLMAMQESCWVELPNVHTAKL